MQSNEWSKDFTTKITCPHCKKQTSIARRHFKDNYGDETHVTLIGKGAITKWDNES